MKEKNPWIAAILNFLFPGIGFAYIGTTMLVVWGVLFCITDIILTIVVAIILTKHMIANLFLIPFQILCAFSFAGIAFAVAEIYNKSIQAQSESLPKKEA